jgi:hypothetical protein
MEPSRAQPFGYQEGAWSASPAIASRIERQSMITALHVENFLGVSSLSTTLTKTVLVAGPNAAGKSSLAHAIRLALGGELARVTLKKQAGALVKNGARSTTIKLESPDFNPEVKVTASGSMSGVPKDIPASVQCALDQTRFIAMNPDQRRDLLFGMTPWPGLADIQKRMAKRGCDAARIEEVSSLLVSLEFGAALKYAEDKQAQARKAWTSLAGETYGDVKAEAWQAPCVMPEPSSKTLQASADAMDKELEAIMEQIATIKASDPDKLLACPQCGTHLVFAYGRLDKHEVTGVKKDTEAPSIADLTATQRELTKQKNAVLLDLARATDQERIAGKSVAITQAAMEHHQAVIGWGRVRDAMSPAGIPSELIYELLNSINLDMAKMSERAGFKRPVSLDENMEPAIGSTPYALASESEKWRMQALITLALAKQGGAGTVIWDGMDIIEPASRIGLINLAAEASPQIIMVATLKTKPAIAGVTTVWMG